MTNRTQARETLTFVFLMSCMVLGAAHCAASCSPFAPADGVRVLDVAGYTAALTQCRTEGKAAKSYPVYEQCAQEADRKYGVRP